MKIIILYILIATQSTITDSASSTTATTPAANTSSMSSFTTSAHTARALLEVRCAETFIPELSDSSSQAFKARAKHVKDNFETIYKMKYPSFIRAHVLSFRAGSIITSIELSFNSTLPSDVEISDILLNNQTNVNVLNISSVSVTVNDSAVTSSIVELLTLPGSSNTSAFTTTSSKATLPAPAAFHTSQSSTTNATSTTTASTLISAGSVSPASANSMLSTVKTSTTLTTISSTATSTLASSFSTGVNATILSSTALKSTAVTVTKTSTATTTLVPEILTDLEFHSSDTFTNGLNDSESQEFKKRSKLVKDQLESVYKPKYVNFLRAIVQGFRPGSIITTTQLVFSLNQSVPSRKEISDTLLTAAETGNINPLNIIPQTISINGSTFATPPAPSTETTTSSASKIELHLLQATCLIIMPKILRLFL